MLKNLNEPGPDRRGHRERRRPGRHPGRHRGRRQVHASRQLLTYLMIISGNDAANALARVNGGYDKTIADMNATAKALGALDTRAATSSGLDGPGQSTSAYDLALFAKADMAIAPFPEIIVQLGHPGPGRRRRGLHRRQRQPAARPSTRVRWAARPGSPTTPATPTSGWPAKDGRRLVVTMMNGTQQPRRQWMQGASLLDWGFALPASTAPVGAAGRTRWPRRPPVADTQPDADRLRLGVRRSGRVDVGLRGRLRARAAGRVVQRHPGGLDPGRHRIAGGRRRGGAAGPPAPAEQARRRSPGTPSRCPSRTPPGPRPHPCRTRPTSTPTRRKRPRRLDRCRRTRRRTRPSRHWRPSRRRPPSRRRQPSRRGRQPTDTEPAEIDDRTAGGRSAETTGPAEPAGNTPEAERTDPDTPAQDKPIKE